MKIFDNSEFDNSRRAIKRKCLQRTNFSSIYFLIFLFAQKRNP